MNEDSYKYYKPAVRGKFAALFFAVFGLFPVFGMILMVLGQPGPGVTLTVFGLLILALLFFQFSAAGKKYGIGRKGVLLKTLTKQMVLPFRDLEGVSLLNADQFSAFMNSYYRPVAEAEKAMDPGSWFKSIKKYGGLTRYMSVTITGTETRKGGPVNITDYKVHIEGKAVLLKTGSGDIFLVTPIEAEGFTNRIRAALVPYIPPETFAETTFTREDREAIRSVGPSPRMRRFVAVNAVISLLLAGGVLFYVFVIRPDSAGSGIHDNFPEEVAAEEPAVRAKGAWENESLFYFAVPAELTDKYAVDDQSDLAPWRRELALNAMLDLFAEENGKELPPVMNKEAVEKLSDFLMLQSRIKLIESGVNENGAAYSLFSVEGSHIREYLEQEIAVIFE